MQSSSNTLLTSPKSLFIIPSAIYSIISLSLVIPTYNEKGNIRQLISILSNLLDQTLPGRYELIIVDDDSPDLTWQVAMDCQQEYPHVRVIRRQGERGLSSAVIRGWQQAEGQFLGVIDGDLQHPPEILLRLIEAVVGGADLAVASRHSEGGGVSEWSLLRRFLSRGAQLLGLIILPQIIGRLSDPMSGYFLVRRTAIAERKLNPIGYKILIEVLGRGQIEDIVEVPYVFQEREVGNSKVTSQQYLNYLRHLFRLRFTTGRLIRVKRFIYVPIKRFLKFGLVGTSGLFVDMGLLYLLFDGLGWGLTRSSLIAAEIAIINNFLWNDRWTFRDASRNQRQFRKTIKRLLKFNVICIVGLGAKVLLLNFFFNIFGWNAYLSNFVAIMLVTVWNFLLSWKLGWRVTQQ